jgi:hypothetical protein
MTGSLLLSLLSVWKSLFVPADVGGGDVKDPEARAEIFNQSLGSRNRVGIGLSYQPTRLHRAGGIHSLESNLGLHKRLKIRALHTKIWASFNSLPVRSKTKDDSVRWDPL